MLAAKCSMCHAANGQKGLNVSTYQSLMAGSTNGAVITPNDPQNSLLIQIQNGTQPHFGQLSPEELQLMTSWIEAGAPEQ
jgi:uncharacterized membrane protein